MRTTILALSLLLSTACGAVSESPVDGGGDHVGVVSGAAGAGSTAGTSGTGGSSTGGSSGTTGGASAGTTGGGGGMVTGGSSGVGNNPGAGSGGSGNAGGAAGGGGAPASACGSGPQPPAADCTRDDQCLSGTCAGGWCSTCKDGNCTAEKAAAPHTCIDDGWIPSSVADCGGVCASGYTCVFCGAPPNGITACVYDKAATRVCVSSCAACVAP